MNDFKLIVLVILSVFFSAALMSQDKEHSDSFTLFNKNQLLPIVYDANGNSLDSIAANLLADDILRVTGQRPRVDKDSEQTHKKAVIIGNIASELIQQNLNKKLKKDFVHQSESYVIQRSLDKNKLIIAGTDPRGTAYGVFQISKQIGVNPWYWWADVPVPNKERLVIKDLPIRSKQPSVSYRGIFLNDEDWGLLPWASKTLEPETANIGPSTYAKIFELLLRLNANTIWPAMHPGTKAFFKDQENAAMAKKYHIVIGSSHAEPMLRNNVDEWDKEVWGDFNYKINKENVFRYWEERVAETQELDAIYTIGMRGIHDSGMQGVKGTKQAIELLEGVISDQRHLLQKYINQDLSLVPQAFTVYKEVLDLYKNGLHIPEDISLVWTDDNYGYIRALKQPGDDKRSGGNGVYYHASYWGRPHDYLWLSTTPPSLIREEMLKAYYHDAKEIWILNVGDIKPTEFQIQFFLDMAYDIDKFKDHNAVENYRKQFYKAIFGKDFAEQISDLKANYYSLAFERKPEFMGWSQTEPTTGINQTAYDPFRFSDEIDSRIQEYELLEVQVDCIKKLLPKQFHSAFMQLVEYPVITSSKMNKKFLYKDKALKYSLQSRKSASHYRTLAKQAYEDIQLLTKNYNELSQGKWKGIMDMKPRRLPVFDMPVIQLDTVESVSDYGIDVEGKRINETGEFLLPIFYVDGTSAYFVDFYLKNKVDVQWMFNQLPSWVKVSKQTGILHETKLEDRIYVTVDWQAWRQASKPASGTLGVLVNGTKKLFKIQVSDSYQELPKWALIEKNGYLVCYASNYQVKTLSANGSWEKIPDLGHSGSVMQYTLLDGRAPSFSENNSVLEYEFFTQSTRESADLYVIGLPTHPITTDGNLRIGVQWNNEPMEIINFKTIGRSATWKKNVLRNKAIKKVQVPIKTKGLQRLRIYSIDDGVLLDHIVLSTNGEKPPYMLLKETVK